MGTIHRLKAEVGHLQSRLGKQKTAQAEHNKRLTEEATKKIESQAQEIKQLKQLVEDLQAALKKEQET